jgi:glycosyltransferase involved in cell wall biosynthesis
MSRRLHLLEVGVRWPPESYVAWKLEGLAEHGMRVTVASSQIFDPAARLRGVELVPIQARPTTLAAATRVAASTGAALLALLVTAPIRAVKLLRSARRQTSRRPGAHRAEAIRLLALCLPLARLRPDVVHFEWNLAAAEFLPLFEVCPVTTSCRGSDISVHPHVPGKEAYAGRLREVFGRAHAVHCVSESQRQEAEAFGLDPAKARVIRTAVDPCLFKPSPRPAGEDRAALRVIAVGRLGWEKGHEYGLEAIRILLDQGVAVELEIFGAVPGEKRSPIDERARVLHTVADLGLEGRVRLHGHASSGEISQRLRASDVLLHAGVIEGIPAAIVEAMACGLPVVAVGSGGVPEAITDGVDGFLVAPRDPEKLAAALRRLGEDAHLRERMGQAGRRKVLSQMTLEHEHGEFLAMYRAVARA